jgi:flagellar biosynthesis protein FliR
MIKVLNVFSKGNVPNLIKLYKAGFVTNIVINSMAYAQSPSI